MPFFLTFLWESPMVRTLHCSTNVKNFNICLDDMVAGFGHRGPLPGDKIYLLVKIDKKTLCGARFELDEVTDERPWEDSEKYVLCYSIKNVEFCNFFDVEFLSEIGGMYWTLKYLQGSKGFDDLAASKIDEVFCKNKCDERQYLEVKDEKNSENENADEDDIKIDDKDVQKVLKEIPEAEIKIMGTFQTINFHNETDKFIGLETLVNKNFFSLFTKYREEKSILIAKNHLFKTQKRDENISGISGIPDALLITYDKRNSCPLQISLIEYECYGEGKTKSTEKSKYLNSHIIPQLMQFASSFSIITDQTTRTRTTEDWIKKIVEYTSKDEYSKIVDSWMKDLHPNLSERFIVSTFEKKLTEAFRSNIHIYLIIDELSADQKETIKNIITSFKLERGNPIVFDASIVKLVQKISFVNQDYEYGLTAQ